MMATLQIRGQSASWNDALNRESSSWRAKGPSYLRNFGRMLSGPAALCVSRYELLTIVQICLWRSSFYCRQMEC